MTVLVYPHEVLAIFKRQIQESLDLVPFMPSVDKVAAVEFWNEVSEKLQEVVNASADELIKEVSVQQKSPKKKETKKIEEQKPILSKRKRPVEESVPLSGVTITPTYSNKISLVPSPSEREKSLVPPRVKNQPEVSVSIAPPSPIKKGGHKSSEDSEHVNVETSSPLKSQPKASSSRGSVTVTAIAHEGNAAEQDIPQKPEIPQHSSDPKLDNTKKKKEEVFVQMPGESIKSAREKVKDKFVEAQIVGEDPLSLLPASGVELGTDIVHLVLTQGKDVKEKKNEDLPDDVELVYHDQHPPAQDETERRVINSLPDGSHEFVYMCKYCNKTFVTPAQLTAHRWQHTKPFACDICHDRFPAKGNLIVHRRRHTGERPFSCPRCDGRFSTRGNLKRHLRTHTGDKPWQCQLCSGRFTEKKSLKIHMRKHTGERPYECDVCHKRFAQTGILATHKALHTGVKGHLCDLCGKSFRQKSQLKLHKQRHEGVRRFPCDHCQSKFLTRADLERHLRTHTGERPYVCLLCHKSFTRQQSLNEHKNRHFGHKPYQCKRCAKSFAEMSSCYKHLKTHKNCKDDEGKPGSAGIIINEVPQQDGPVVHPVVDDEEEEAANHELQTIVVEHNDKIEPDSGDMKDQQFIILEATDLDGDVIEVDGQTLEATIGEDGQRIFCLRRQNETTKSSDETIGIDEKDVP